MLTVQGTPTEEGHQGGGVLDAGLGLRGRGTELQLLTQIIL